MLIKRFVFAFSLIVATGLVAGENPRSDEREKAVQYLERTRDDLLAATKGLSAAQWNFKPAADRWSVAEITEHLAATEEHLMSTIREKVMSAPPRPEGEDVKAIDEFVLKNIPDRSNKVQAPEPLRPENRFGSPAESLKAFNERRAKTIEYAKSAKELRDHAIDTPFGKKMDGHQWLLFIAAHSERHTKQLNEVKASPDFPKK